ncbi:SDR family NAD(P)-dependent oxidoreductase [Elioraea tepida]|jgi:UDP-glucuronate 4-epimerase|uniref:SDR family NAD(P)-dependent oxidoreductase n=1 Tax=Elioraea tepida TaxID=2843330 RepID=A0A975U0L2_9PROT|nr:SDR family NAD(P)-dependent oxidoreductase [Elioraea tepida]QXM23563.1 SDR family NAD(P)-dependent oxidoreductase [Elioraea tepida]
MTILVTGAAGFIGFHLARALLARGERVIGVDNVNDYYDPALKEARLAVLEAELGFTFVRGDLADHAAVLALAERFPGIDRIVHLAAQAGVRYAEVNPWAYVDANAMGQVAILELARRLGRLSHVLYASSSSVYGGNTKLPFSETDPVERPFSLYAATKRGAELIAAAYAHLHGIPSTGLRFFTVYGPWGRPDMAAYLFAKAITEGRPITVFGEGKLTRDFTYIDDIVAGILGCLDAGPAVAARPDEPGGPPHRVYNLGNHRSEPLSRYIGLIEEALGRRAIVEHKPRPRADVPETYADITRAREDFGFDPATPIDLGIPSFIAWFRAWHGV